ncbi:TPA: hypothetical protein ACK3Q6_005373 [Burkholderia cepacia]|uniref:hypothetical protein n=1 Tax=Burkholderia cepacia TaxID=292 RepID=UPI001CF32AF0|nr:hypothetical protein [Burkholderia cepacia]MCA8359627.1 hypothetical protein [Burkholderia cepacia]HDR9760452.1 hypothetical protein [Burkholderia cepacia ATCC 25416]HDV6369625.1 hypothetical protein [Burkholderia cepacia]
MREPLFRKEQRLFHFPDVMASGTDDQNSPPATRSPRHWYLRVALNFFKLRSAPGDLNKFRINLKQGIIDACTR